MTRKIYDFITSLLTYAIAIKFICDYKSGNEEEKKYIVIRTSLKKVDAFINDQKEILIDSGRYHRIRVEVNYITSPEYTLKRKFEGYEYKKLK